MVTLKYTITEIAPDVEWEELLYHGSVKVVGGIAQVAADDDLTLDAMLRRGFEVVEEAKPELAEAAAPKKPKKAEPTEAEPEGDATEA